VKKLCVRFVFSISAIEKVQQLHLQNSVLIIIIVGGLSTSSFVTAKKGIPGFNLYIKKNSCARRYILKCLANFRS
jgi:hypothetical protein